MTPSLIIQCALFASGLLVSVVSTVILTKGVRAFAIRKGLVDSPNSRSVHKHPIPRIGGIALVGGVCTGLAFFALLGSTFTDLRWVIELPHPLILWGALLMFLLGLADDLFGLSAFSKLTVESVVALLIIVAGIRFELPFFNEGPLQPLGLWLSTLITFGWIIGVINAVNLIDGVDGLAAGIGMTTIASLALALALIGEGPDLALTTVFIGALAGFLLFNFHPASIFMGDSGSLFLGFILATFSLPASQLTTNGLTFLVPILALGLPVLDTITSIVRRLCQRRNIFAPDRDHIHHRLLCNMGHAQRSTVCILYGVNALFGMVAILILAFHSIAAVSLILSIAAIMILLFLRQLGYIRIESNDQTGGIPQQETKSSSSATHTVKP